VGKRTPPRFQLGEKVKFTDTVTKDRDQGHVSWVPAGLPNRLGVKRLDGTWSQTTTPLSEGIIVGQRSLAEYEVGTETDYEDWGHSSSYTYSNQIPGTQKKAWIVAFDLHRKPVLVLDEHVESIPEEES
jgi:hypothetical protein